MLATSRGAPGLDRLSPVAIQILTIVGATENCDTMRDFPEYHPPTLLGFRRGLRALRFVLAGVAASIGVFATSGYAQVAMVLLSAGLVLLGVRKMLVRQPRVHLTQPRPDEAPQRSLQERIAEIEAALRSDADVDHDWARNEIELLPASVRSRFTAQ